MFNHVSVIEWSSVNAVLVAAHGITFVYSITDQDKR